MESGNFLFRFHFLRDKDGSPLPRSFHHDQRHMEFKEP